MLKYLLKALIDRQNDDVLSIQLLKKFVETKEFKKMKKRDDVSFSQFLHFLQNEYPDAIDSIGRMLGKKPYIPIVLYIDWSKYQMLQETRAAYAIHQFLVNEPGIFSSRFFGEQRPSYGSNEVSDLYNGFLVEMAGLACIEFRKGTKQIKNPDVSVLCQLPKDIIKAIFTYIFPFPNMTAEVVVKNKQSQVYLSDEFAMHVFDLKFFGKNKHSVHFQDTTQHQEHHKKCNVM